VHTYIFSLDWKVLYLIVKELSQVIQNRTWYYLVITMILIFLQQLYVQWLV